MTAPHNRAVVFIDLLGFTKLTEDNPLDLEAIKRSQSPLSGMLDQLFAADRNPLTRAFTTFHRTLKWAVEIAQMKHSLTAITFSDSAFIATTKLSESVNMATYILQTLLRARVPARAGIAYGSFSAVRFRSDIYGDGGDHAAHFLGRAVIWSHAAERCGIKGIRILLHPSAVALMNDQDDEPSRDRKTSYIACSEAESANSLRIEYEIDYWHLKPTAESEAWLALQDMWSAAPEAALPHYEATAHAINRMRVRQGEEPLANLRRRTLTRRKSRMA
jgi:hypothetical protein